MILYVENTFDKNVSDALKKMGYTISIMFGIWKNRSDYGKPDGIITGVADNRGDDAAAGY